MSTPKAEGNSDVASGNSKQKWATLTQEDLLYVKGRHEEWLERIQKRTGQTREMIDEAIKDVFSSHKYAVA